MNRATFNPDPRDSGVNVAPGIMPKKTDEQTMLGLSKTSLHDKQYAGFAAT